MPSSWGTIADAAARKQVSVKTVRRWIAAGLVTAERIGPRLIRVDLDSLDMAGRTLDSDFADYVERVVKTAPPLTDAQRDRIAALLKPTPRGDAA